MANMTPEHDRIGASLYSRSVNDKNNIVRSAVNEKDVVKARKKLSLTPVASDRVVFIRLSSHFDVQFYCLQPDPCGSELF